jgi:hypothetical protein
MQHTACLLFLSNIVECAQPTFFLSLNQPTNWILLCYYYRVQGVRNDFATTDRDFFFVSQVKILRGSGARDDDDGWMMG